MHLAVEFKDSVFPCLVVAALEDVKEVASVIDLLTLAEHPFRMDNLIVAKLAASLTL